MRSENSRETEDLPILYTAILPVYVTLLVQQLQGKLGELLLVDLTKFNATSSVKHV